MSKETQGLREFVDAKTNQVIGVVREEGASTREVVNQATNQIIRVVREEGATTRAFVDVKTNEVKEVIISTVREEGQATRAFVDEKGNQVIAVVKEEGAKTRTEVRSEGAKIREHIDVKTDEVKNVVRVEGLKTRLNANANAVALKKYINSTGQNVKKQVVKSQQDITNLSEKQFEQLSNSIDDVTRATEAAASAVAGNGKGLEAIDAVVSDVDCKEGMWGPNSNFRSALQLYTAPMDKLQALFREPTLDGKKMMLGTRWDQFVPKLPSVFVYIRRLYYLLQLNLKEAVGPNYPLLTDKTPVAFSLEYDQLTAAVLRLHNDGNGEMQNNFARLLKGEHVDITSKRWEDLRLSIKFPPRSVWDVVPSLIQTACKNSSNMDCCRSWNLIGRSTYSDAYALLASALVAYERVRTMSREWAGTENKCKVSDTVKGGRPKPPQDRRLRALATMATNPNEPFCAMIYSALVKVLLDYCLQEAADQFCKYYEFRNGGVAPPMCGTNAPGATRPYYSLSTIQAMRSWQPPVYPRITSRILLPTQPLVQSGTGRAYPFVDLAALASGNSVTFDVPTWDLDWLKRYQWVPSNAKPETLASYYVESMRLYLPIEASGSSPPTSSLAVTVVAESSFQQSVTWQSTGRTYQLPPQRFQSGVTYNLPVCASTSQMTNPYHESAKCVDQSSEMCLTQETTENSPRLLPTFFSSWHLRADVDLNTTQFCLVQPLAAAANATAAPVEFNLLADVTLVRVAASPRSAIAPAEDAGVAPRGPTKAVAASCCARDKYLNLQSRACAKCPENSVPALNGYTCTTK